MNKKLSVVQIILGCLSFILPFLDIMFVWTVYTIFENRNKLDMSLYNLMTVQRIGAGPFLFWSFIILLIAIVAYFIIEIFMGDKIPNNKISIIVSFLPLLVMILMIITAANHTDTFTSGYEVLNVAVTATIFSYIELMLLGAIGGIECYKKLILSKTDSQPTDKTL